MADELPATYQEQRGCHNCRSVFFRHEYDEWPQYYCSFGAPKRPLCLSCSMSEMGDDHGDDWRDDAAKDRRRKAWRQWSEGREVQTWGICENWTEASIDTATPTPAPSEP